MARRRAKPTPKKLADFLERLSETGNVLLSAEMLNLDRRALYVRRREDREFANAWEEAVDQAADALENEARRRALDGWEEPVYQGGLEVGAVRKYSDTLLIFLLKGIRPEKFRDRQQLEHVGKDGEALPAAQVHVYLPGNGRDEPAE